jgi:C_GCAxxG_C_C family probable redox protein
MIEREAEMIEKTAQRARQLFTSTGFYCAESVLIALSEQEGVQSEIIPKIATGFCSGMARTCGQCGAVSGAVMGIGLACGRDTPHQPIDPTYIAVRSFLSQFQAQFGSLNCQDLTGCDLGTPDGQIVFRTGNVILRCQNYVEEAARLAVRIIKSVMQ